MYIYCNFELARHWLQVKKHWLYVEGEKILNPNSVINLGYKQLKKSCPAVQEINRMTFAFSKVYTNEMKQNGA